MRRFHGMKTEMGFDQLLPLTLFNDESKGYLIDDCCTFGAEIFVIKHTSKGECLSLMKQPSHSSFTWSIQKFSALDQESCKSQVFATGGHKWYVKLKEMLCARALIKRAGRVNDCINVFSITFVYAGHCWFIPKGIQHLKAKACLSS